MQIDQKALSRILAQDDAGLRRTIAALAAGAGIDPSTLRISDADLANLRRTLTGASPAELARLATTLRDAKGADHGK